MSQRILIIVLLIAFSLVSWPVQWYPMSMRVQFAQWFGPSNYRPLPSTSESELRAGEEACPLDLLSWRNEQIIEGVNIRPDLQCVVDNPNTVAAFVRGTNNISQEVLINSGLAPDAVVKGADLDGDGDPDEIFIRLEVVELNGSSPDTSDLTAQFAIAPGIKPGFWVFAPKTIGMATENFDSLQAKALFRFPSPAIRVEQGDQIYITLENSHYMPHTIHFHGVDHPFLDENGEGNDGVPITSEIPVQPGGDRTYELQPRQTGTMFYHCHVQPQAHAMMGLQGLFIVEENRPDNWLQTLNVGGGLVRAPSQEISEFFDREYDLHYLDIDAELNTTIQNFNDPRSTNDWMLRGYNTTEARSEYFTLNGRSFPYTFRESLIVAKPDEKIKLRVLNGGSVGISLHTHGHKVTITHNDGIEINPESQIIRDVVFISPAQRADLTLETSNDGLHSYGSGIWLLHDHQPAGVTTDGIGPGGNVSAIVYEEFLDDNGWPNTQGEDWSQYFTAAYYTRQDIPSWLSGITNPNTLEIDMWLFFRVLAVGLCISVITALILIKPVQRKKQ